MPKFWQQKPFALEIGPLQSLAEDLRSEYGKAIPFPHVVTRIGDTHPVRQVAANLIPVPKMF